MPANFSNLRLSYIHEANNQDDLIMDFNLSSLNFDINHVTVGALTPFTTEFSFILSLDGQNASRYESIQELADLLADHFSGLGDDPIGRITNVLNDYVFTNANLQIDFLDINGVITVPSDPRDTNSTPTPILARSTSLQTLATLITTGDQELYSLSWFVKIKFHATPPIQSISTVNGGVITPLNRSVVLYPELIFPLAVTLDETEATPSLTLVDDFNDELRLNYELTYLPDTGAPTVSSPIGKAADELSDSIANLTSSLAANLTSTFKAQLQPVASNYSPDIILWLWIRRGTDQLHFTRYFDYMESIFCGRNNFNGFPLRAENDTLNRRRSLPFMNVDAYRAVKVATEAFVMVNCMVNQGFTQDDIDDLRSRVNIVDGVPDQNRLNEYFDEYMVRVNGGGAILPYMAVIRRKMSDQSIKFTLLEDAFDAYVAGGQRQQDDCYGIIQEKLTFPCFLELIWSYWHEESMMVQGLAAISRRFQNIRGAGSKDPLANLEIDPLRPLNNLMWGYIQDEQHRLTVRRRAYEYDHHYGITLKGEATRDMRFADSRSKFIEALHTLLNLASRFYKQADDVTVKPDGFPLLNGLRETHLILSEGAHNQYGDLPSVARAEMLMQQWLLARPEYRDFLPTRQMVAYPEPWMDRVSAMNQLMGWTKTSVLHFNYLAIYGEKILLSIRFGNWADQTTRADAAVNWANFWRAEIQGYIHAYRAVTGIDLSAEGVAAGQKVDTLQPSVHLMRQLKDQQSSNGNGQMSKAAAKKMIAK